jgi:hypothetical protein
MNVTMSHKRSLALPSRRTALRNVASTVFAVLFLFVSIVHLASHVDISSAVSGPQIATGTNLPDDGPKTDLVDVCHCALCGAAVVLPTACNSAASETIESTFGIFTFARLSPHDPLTETPPPKSI